MIRDILHEWIMTVDPIWIFMIFPLLFGSVLFSAWLDDLKQKKKERDPRLMDEEEYKHHNRKRFKEIK